MEQSDSPRGARIIKGTANVAFPPIAGSRLSNFGKVHRDRISDDVAGGHRTLGSARRRRFLLGGHKRLALTDGKLLKTPGLSLGADGWTLQPEGNKTALDDVGLVLGYRAGVQ
jgi:hypothetical protein